MTAVSYVVLDSDDLGANKILRAATMSAVDQNPVSIAQRGSGAPWLNGIGAIATLTTGSGNWTVPAGVYRIKVTAVGGGGGYNGGSAGANTTFSTLTANGGSAGGSGSTGAGGAGGNASGGDINVPGTNGQAATSTAGGDNPGYGGCSMLGSIGHGGTGTAGGGGGGGGTAIKVFSVEPGDLMAYSVGTGATDGIIIIEY